MFWPFTRQRARAALSGRYGPYTIVRTLHEGDKAYVYLGKANATGEPVAIKVYKPNFNRTAHRMRKKYRLKREGDIGLLLNPPEGVAAADYPIVRTLATGKENGRSGGALYVVLEYVDGPSLKSLIVTEDPRLPALRVPICLQAARALGILHAKGLVHRDLCSDNFLLNSKGVAKLIDLGFCSRPDIRFEEKTGTPSYMAPEQARVEPVTPRSDIYGLGVVMYELFTGRMPFTSEIKASNGKLAHRRAAEIMTKHIHETPPPPGERAPGVDPRVERIILKCMEKQPARRYGSAQEILRDLTLLAQAGPES